MSMIHRDRRNRIYTPWYKIAGVAVLFTLAAWGSVDLIERSGLSWSFVSMAGLFLAIVGLVLLLTCREKDGRR